MCNTGWFYIAIMIALSVWIVLLIITTIMDAFRSHYMTKYYKKQLEEFHIKMIELSEPKKKK